MKYSRHVEVTLGVSLKSLEKIAIAVDLFTLVYETM